MAFGGVPDCEMVPVPVVVPVFDVIVHCPDRSLTVEFVYGLVIGG